MIHRGHHVTVINDRPVNEKPIVSDVEMKFSAYRKQENPLRYYRDSVLLVKTGYDVILCCGVGGAGFFGSTETPVITNVDGLEHLRTKYSPAKKIICEMATKRKLQQGVLFSWQIQCMCSNTGRKSTGYPKTKFPLLLTEQISLKQH
ncbi:MAG: hypothetical protein U0X76_13140 [Bacteroidia bacterium]